MIWYTLGILPIYLALRWPFFKLPLHMDTGYYVSNHTIVSKKIDYSKGWNAAFAGCSKVVPELFYSWIYLLHGGNGYKLFSRLYYSVYNFATAVVVGMTMYMIVNRSVLAYCTAFTLYCLLSSEPHYGVYFESGEQFEVLPQVLSFYLFVWGIAEGSALFVAGAIGFWLSESYFIKLSSLPGALVLAIGGSLFVPRSAPILLGVAVVASGVYIMWLIGNSRDLRPMLQALVAHEAFYGRNTQVKTQLIQLCYKGHLFFDVGKSAPIIMLLALPGLLIAGERAPLLFVYLLAVTAGYVVQVCRIWYYTIPFLPVLTCLATLSAMEVIGLGTIGIVIMIVALGAWFAIHLASVIRRDVRTLNNYVWRPHGSAMAEKNFALDALGPDLRAIVDGRSLFIFGPYNQGYVLADASYDTPLICAYSWLNVMRPNWLKELNEQLVASPPFFILDTDSCFQVEVVRERIGLDYQLTKRFPGGFHLYQFQAVTVSLRRDLECQSFALSSG